MFGKGMGNMAGMMKKVQKMQADMKKMQRGNPPLFYLF